MSSTIAYLNSLLKTDLTEFAEISRLPSHAGLKKADLIEQLDDHLKRNTTTYSKEPTLKEFYKRYGVSTRSPIKKIAEKVSDIVKSDDDISPAAVATAKKIRRKTQVLPGDSTDTDGAITTLTKTPAKALSRTSAVAANYMPPSPAVVTDAIDRQSKRIRTSISHAYNQTGFTEYSDFAREYLSSTVTINVLAILIEAFSLEHALIPNKQVTEIGPISFIKDTPTKVKIPDLFQLLSPDFWAPFSLWLLTTLILPAAVSYFVNLPLRQVPGAARRSSMKSNPHIQFDPFVFNLAKGLIIYLVYSAHFQLLEVYSNTTIAKVNTSIPGGYHGMLISTGLGAAVSLYEAVLKR